MRNRLLSLGGGGRQYEFQERYEEIRDQVDKDGPVIDPSNSVALLLNRGFPEWMRVWSHCVHPKKVVPFGAKTEKGGLLPRELQDRVASVLASMALEAGGELVA